MEMPRPGPAQERLHIFIGEWRGKETMHPTQWMPEGGARDAVISNKLGLDGFAVIQDYVQYDGDTRTFVGHAVIMKHPHVDSYQMYWFDSFSPSVFEGDWDGARGSFIQDGPMGKARATYDFSEPNAYTFRMEMSQDGQTWSPMMDGEYSRV